MFWDLDLNLPQVQAMLRRHEKGPGFFEPIINISKEKLGSNSNTFDGKLQGFWMEKCSTNLLLLKDRLENKQFFKTTFACAQNIQEQPGSKWSNRLYQPYHLAQFNHSQLHKSLAHNSIKASHKNILMLVIAVSIMGKDAGIMQKKHHQMMDALKNILQILLPPPSPIYQHLFG